MKRFLKFVLMLGPPLIAVGWTFLVTNFFGIALDRATFSAPGNGNVPVYNSTSKTWKVGSAGGTVGIQLNGSPVTGSPASTINLQNGLTVVGNVTGGVATLQPNYGTAASTVSAGNDTRFNAAPSAAGKLSVDTGSAWHSLAAGATGTLLHGNGAADPTWSPLVDADITAGTITAGSLATATVNRLMLTPATIGRIEVDGGAGNPPVALAQGTSVQFLQSGGAATNPAFVSFSGDFTVAAGGLATLASTISAAGPIGDGTHVAQITFDAKGRLTAVTSVAITASGSTIALQNGGSGVTGSPAGTLNATNGLTFGTVSAGVSALAPSYGTGSNTFEQGNDTRNNAAPSAAGKLSVDTGSAWHSIAAGAANTLLHGAGAADPTYSAVALADMATQAAKTVLANATNATAVPSAVGGTADQFLQISHANTALGFVTLGGDATLSDGTLTIGAQAVGPTKIAGSATRGQMLKTTTASAAPTWADAPMSSVSGGYVTRTGTTLQFLPDVSNRVWCFESSSWVEKVIPDAGPTAVTCTGLTASTDYFLYVYDNAGTLTLDLSTTGTTPINNILVKSGTTSRTLIARCHTNGSGAITTVNEDAATQLVCNVYNRRLIGLFAGDTTNSWTYQSTTYREFNGLTAAQVTLVQLGQDQVSCEAHAAGSTGAQDVPFVGVGVDSTSSNTAQMMEYPRSVNNIFTIEARLFTTLTAGFHTIAALEACDGATAAVTFVGKDGVTGKVQTGVMVMGRF